MDEGRSNPQLTTVAYTLLRVIAGLMLMQHGLQKLFGLLQTNPANPWGGPPALLSQFWIAGVLEMGGGFLVAIGLFTRPVAFVLSGLMAAAYFTAHWRWFSGPFFPIVNRGELAALYCFVFLYVAATGAGRYSVDALLRGRRHDTSTGYEPQVTAP